jgi:phytoene desaturase
MTPSTDLPIIVIGGGIGGLAAAISLACKGYAVHLYEQQPTVGGKMSQFTDQGFRWDTGPSVITMSHVFTSLFMRAGRRVEDYFQLLPLEPLTRYFYTDGTILDASRNWPQMATAIDALEPRDVAGYLRFLAYAADIHRITGPVFIYNQPPTPRTFLTVSPADMLRVDAWSRMDQAIARHVHSPHLRQLLGRFATYVGASPFHAPATLSVVAHVELSGGVWYPKGGVYTIAAGLQRLAEECGVKIHTGAPIDKIIVESGQVQGVLLADGHTLPTATVVANVDVATVYNRLIAPDQLPRRVASDIAQQETSCSGFILLLGVNRQHPDLAHHNIFFAKEYRREFDDIFRAGHPPTDPTVYVAISSKTDPDHAPPGCENWFVLVNAPAADGRYDWQTHARSYRDHVLATLVRFGYDIRSAIVSEQILTPIDLAQRTGAWRGALYGISSNQPLNAFRRPHNRSPHVHGLYFCGGTTHPGGGVPLVTLSGMLAADLLHADRTSV